MPHEIIVVDDGSTDDTSKVLGRFGPPVIVAQQTKAGVSAARNLAMRLSTGDAVMFLDSDDVLLPNCIERTIEQLEAYDDVDVVYADVNLIDPKGKHLGVFSELYAGERPSGMVLGEISYRWSVITVSSTLVRRTALEHIEFDVSLTSAEDFDFWRRLAARGRFLYLDEVLACYRYHGGQVTATQIQPSLDSAVEVQRRIMAMPEFGQVSRRHKSRLYCHHGARNAMLGKCDVARQMFLRAIRTQPSYPTAYLLFALGLLGDHALRFAIEKKRQCSIGQLSRLITNVALPDIPLREDSLLGSATIPLADSAFTEGGCRG